MFQRLEASPVPADAVIEPAAQWVRRVGVVVGVGVAYYVAARVGLQLALVERNVTPLWPPTGIALVSFLVFGKRVWPGVALAAFVVNVPISAGVPAALVTAAGNTAAPLVAASLLERVDFHTAIDRHRDAIAIVLLAALLGMAISATVGTAVLVGEHTIPPSSALTTWAVWWTGDAMGVLVVAPFLLSLLLWGRSPLRWGRVIEAAALFALLLVVCIGVTRTDLRLLFVILPLVGWAAWRFQLRGAAPAALLVIGIATWTAAHGVGPFAHGALFDQMLRLQAFNATVALASLFFAALVTERIRLEASLREALSRERQATSQLRHVDEMKTNFLSTVSHELRTPITISRGHLEVLEPGAATVEVEATAALVLDELDRMARILGDMTTVVRMDDPEFLRLGEEDLSHLIHEIAAKVEPIFGSRLLVSTPPTPAIAKVDVQRLTQAVLNLLHNAEMHTSPTARVELRLQDEPGWWLIEVLDDGDGIPAGTDGSIFDPFRKGRASNGSGLGLAVVRGIAEAHGGSAGVTARPGGGSAFWIRVPQ